MSRPLIVSIPHSLGKEEALRRLKAGMERGIAHVPVMKVDEQTWSGDRMTFHARALGQVQPVLLMSARTTCAWN